MSVRRAELHEAAAIADVFLRSRKASVPAIPPSIHADDDVRAWFRNVVLPAKEVWVVEVDGAIAALMVLEDEWVDQLYVDPSYTGSGLGAELLAVARRERPDGLNLWTFQANTGARRFYERHGFTAVALTDGDNEEGAPDVRYEWRP